MIVTIHQPEHFPYLGFFQKMNKSDLFVVLDNVKYRKNYYQNRNKFLNHTGQEEWFTVPVEKKATSKKIKDVLTAPDSGWKKKLLKKMKSNFGEDFSSIYDGESLADINLRSIEYCRGKMNIEVPIVRASNLPVTGEKTELLFNICAHVGAKTYLSGPSGRDYLDLEMFSQGGIEVIFFDPQVENYYSSLYNIIKKFK